MTQLPLARIKKLIKNGDPEWKGGSQDSQLMIVYAAERFCSQLAGRVWEQKVRQTGMIFENDTEIVNSRPKNCAVTGFDELPGVRFEVRLS